MTIYHDEIITWIKPCKSPSAASACILFPSRPTLLFAVAEKLKDNQWAWIVPVGILFVLSFPPLFGHEIIGVLCGLIWGLWVGFGIVRPFKPRLRTTRNVNQTKTGLARYNTRRMGQLCRISMVLLRQG